MKKLFFFLFLISFSVFADISALENKANQDEGVQQDYHKAKEYYGLACDNGLQIGCDHYSDLYKKGF